MIGSKLLSAFDFSDEIKNILVFGDLANSGAECALALAQKKAASSIKVVAAEADYLFVGKALRDKVIQSGCRCDALVTSDINEISALLEVGDAVVAVGDWALYRDVALTVGEGVVFVPTGGIFAQAFSPLLPRKDGCGFFKNPKPYKAIIDVNRFKNLKRNELFDGYSYLSAKVGEAVEYKMFNRIFHGEKPLDGLDLSVNRLTRLLSDMTEETARGVILIGQLAILDAISKYDYFGFLDSFVAGDILSKMTGESLYGCVNGLIGPLLLAIRGYTHVDTGAFCETGQIFDIEALCEITGTDEGEFVKTYKPFTAAEIKDIRQGLYSFDGMLAEAINRGALLNGGADKVYRGRHRRGDFSQKDVKKALKLGGLRSIGVLKSMYQEGYCKILEEI